MMSDKMLSMKLEELVEEWFAEMTVEDWLSASVISEEDQEKYENAKKAAEIKASPLWKALL